MIQGPLGNILKNDYWKNLWHRISTGVSDFISGRGKRFSELFEIDPSSVMGSAISKTTGAHLTGAEQEANEFTRNERLEAQQWQENMSNTELQRRVADAKAAGINPMMVASGGASTPSSSGGQSVSPSSGIDFSNILSLMMQAKLLPAQEELIRSQAAAARGRAEESRAKIPFWEAKSDEALNRAKLALKQIETEDKKGEFYLARAVLANVNADNIQYLQESVKQLNEAKTQEAQAQAFMSTIHGLYEQKMLDLGYIEELVKNIHSETGYNYAAAGERHAAEQEHRASAAEHFSSAKLKNKQGEYVDVQKEGQAIANSLADGTFTDKYDANQSWWDKFIIQGSRFTSGILGPVGSIAAAAM